ncbi:MAG: response regulator [Kofleriaceae bacterium]
MRPVRRAHPGLKDPGDELAELRADNARLRGVLDDKLRQLIRRERDVHTLLRKISVASRWYETGARLAAQVAATPDRGAALRVIAEVFAEDLGYEYVQATWGAEVVLCPALPPPELAAIMTAAAGGGEGGLTEHLDPDGLVRECLRLDIRSKERPADVVVVVTARTARTAAVPVALEQAARERMLNLADILGSAVDAVALRAALVRERDSLAAAVADATVDLRAAVATAERARADAERAASARTEFLANMSHEIRTPMTAILGYAELLLDADVAAHERDRYVDTIARSGRHLLQLLDDILDLARLESGRTVIAPQPVSVPALLLDVHSLLAVRAADRRLDLAVVFATPIPDQLILDGNRLRQIVINLVGNALKFTDRGGVTIEAGYLAGTLTVRVIDTGIGIPPDRIDAMFEAFEQIEQASQRRTGTGLGLAISRRLARLMGGELAATSALGVGSTFVVTAPATLAAGATLVATPSACASTDLAVAAVAALAGRVLVADDTAANRAVFAAMIARTGLTVDLAADGRQAIELVEAAAAAGRPYDVVLMDMQMPVMDGYQAAAQLRQRYADLPIIAITAHAMAGDRDACLEAGCSDYLAKPVRRDHLYATLARHTQVVSQVGPPMPNPPTAAPPALTPVVSEFLDDDIIVELLPEFIADVRTHEVELAARAPPATGRGSRRSATASRARRRRSGSRCSPPWPAPPSGPRPTPRCRWTRSRRRSRRCSPRPGASSCACDRARPSPAHPLPARAQRLMTTSPDARTASTDAFTTAVHRLAVQPDSRNEPPLTPTT